ncbi:MAG: RNA 2',3'-cyclic phosphodiesterase [Rhodospirillales bacterium]|nr:RNA 2',3'-cyclic phosphodiesterase [Rhodospirillales bacterium]
MFRLFVGVLFPDDIRNRLSSLYSGLPGARWVDAQSMHLTLRFIGEVGGGQAEDIDAALQRVTAPAFDLVVSSVDFFESGGKVHTLWAGVDKQPLLMHLRDKIESAVVRAGCTPERRKFKAHVTLARFRTDPGPRIGAFLQLNGRLSIGPFTIDRFILFRSHLGSERAHYEILAEYPLDLYAAPRRAI